MHSLWHVQSARTFRRQASDKWPKWVEMASASRMASTAQVSATSTAKHNLRRPTALCRHGRGLYFSYLERISNTVEAMVGW